MKYPFLSDTLNIILNKGTKLLVSINMFTQKLRITRRDQDTENEDAINFNQASSMIWSGNGSTMDNITSVMNVAQYIARTNNMLVAAGKEAMTTPGISLCNTPKTQQIVVVDLSPKGKKKSRDRWDEEQRGWHYSLDEDEDISLRRVRTLNIKIKPWPFTNIYLGDNDDLGLPAMFFYPLLKRFMDDQLSDPYFFKDRDKVILNLPDLYTTEDRINTASHRGKWGGSETTVKWNDYQAEYDKAKEVLKRL